MSGVRAERRTALVAIVEMSWEDQKGAVRSGPARMEDRSPSGACVRVKSPIRVGAKVNIKWRWEQFSGTTRYCRTDGWEYLVGIQRDPKNGVQSDLPPTSQRDGGTSVVRPPAPAVINQPRPQAGKTESPPAILAASGTPAGSKSPIGKPIKEAVNGAEAASNESTRASGTQAEDGRSARHTGNPTSETGERGSMPTKWFDIALKWPKTDAPNGKVSNTVESAEPKKAAPPEKEKPPASEMPQPTVRFEGDLLSAEDVYRAAGILNPRMGYSIRKVVEMLHSEHIRDLPNDAKRAAVLMALDAAGISIDEVLRDAASRRKALEAARGWSDCGSG